MAAISYDSSAILKSFAERRNITFPMLSDPGSKIILTYGIFNETTPRGPFYGIPYPGTCILNTDGVVVAKYFEDDYSQRYTAADILANRYHAPVGATHSSIEAKHLHISTSPGTEIVHVGQRIVLAADIEMLRGGSRVCAGCSGIHSRRSRHHELGRHHCAPGCISGVEATASESDRRNGPVYTGQVRVLREITIGKNVKPGELVVAGTFRYQACDDRQCFVP